MTKNRFEIKTEIKGDISVRGLVTFNGETAEVIHVYRGSIQSVMSLPQALDHATLVSGCQAEALKQYALASLPLSKPVNYDAKTGDRFWVPGRGQFEVLDTYPDWVHFVCVGDGQRYHASYDRLRFVGAQYLAPEADPADRPAVPPHSKRREVF